MTVLEAKPKLYSQTQTAALNIVSTGQVYSKIISPTHNLRLSKYVYQSLHRYFYHLKCGVMHDYADGYFSATEMEVV